MADNLTAPHDGNPKVPHHQQEDEWTSWYKTTFSNELSLIPPDRNSPRPSMTPPKTPVLGVHPLEAEASILKRRLRSVDAMEALCQEIERLRPVEKDRWEVDAMHCRGCSRELGWLHLRRKHHCRFCGLTYCDDCAPGEVRCCGYCQVQRTRYETVKAVRTLERNFLEQQNNEGSTATGLAVARAYRTAIQSFAKQPGDDGAFLQHAKNVLIEALHSFLELKDVKSNLKI